MGNQRILGKEPELLEEALKTLHARFPEGWDIEKSTVETGQLRDRNQRPDLVLTITSPSGEKATLLVEAKLSLDPRDATRLAEPGPARKDADPVVVVSPFLSPGVRERLAEADIGYLDFTGNVRLILRTPSLYIETSGATRDPSPDRRPRRSIRGPKAGRIIRALCDYRNVGGVTDLAATTAVDAGYVSRLLALLERDALIDRGPRGRVDRADWKALIRRWADDVPFQRRGETASFLDPRGIGTLVDRLQTTDLRYAITGSYAASKVASVAPPRLAILYVDSHKRAAETLELKPTGSGANVLLTVPNDDWVFHGLRERDGVQYAALSQVSADLLTTAGRGPAEAEELMRWMAANEEQWRG